MAQQNFGPHTPIVTPPKPSRAPVVVPAGNGTIGGMDPNLTVGPTGYLVAPPVAVGDSGGGGTGAPSGSGSGTPPPAAPDPDAGIIKSAKALITSFFNSVPGLKQLDPQGLLSNWAVGQISTLAGEGLGASDIITQIESTMNDPEDNGGDQATLDVFNAVFPGYNEKIQAGTTNSDGSYTGLAGYIQYSAQLKQFATQAGLVDGTITQQTIGQMWGGNISSSEVSQRITDATVAATSAPQPVQDYISANLPGMSGTAAIASYYLNPTNTLQQIQTSMNTGMVGGAAAASGFAADLSTAKASALGAFLANGASGGNGSQVGQVNQVGYQQATNAFTSGLGSNGVGGSLASAAQLAQAGYTAGNLPGQTGGTVSEDTLIGAIEGNAGALAQTSQAEQTRTAGSKGGGGFATSSKGAASLGFASEG